MKLPPNLLLCAYCLPTLSGGASIEMPEMAGPRQELGMGGETEGGEEEVSWVDGEDGCCVSTPCKRAKLNTKSAAASGQERRPGRRPGQQAAMFQRLAGKALAAANSNACGKLARLDECMQTRSHDTCSYMTTEYGAGKQLDAPSISLGLYTAGPKQPTPTGYNMLPQPKPVGTPARALPPTGEQPAK